jgi:hypothetical protein
MRALSNVYFQEAERLAKVGVWRLGLYHSSCQHCVHTSVILTRPLPALLQVKK